jgi:raffinose/stachyose/melibiose transport system permease protein
MSLTNASQFSKLKRNERKAKDSKQSQSMTNWLTVAAFVVPGMLLFLVFVLYPIVQSVQFSVYDWDGFGPPTDFIGIDNYTRLFGHGIFQGAVYHSIIIMLLSLSIQLPVALAIALLVGRGELPGRRFFRAMLFIPYVFSETITAIIWLYVLHPHDGLANTVFGALIPNYEPITWLGSGDIVLYSIFMVLIWKYFGFYMILYMAAVQGVSKDLEEAGRIDGASEWDVLRLITLPLIGPTIRLTIYLSILGAVQQFVIVWVMTTGGPTNSSDLMSTYLFKYGIQRFKLGYGSAVAVVLFGITFIFSLLYQRFVMNRDYD